MNETLENKKITLSLDQQGVIELAYTVKECLEPWINSREKMFFEQANGYTASYYIIRTWLKRDVDPEYLNLSQHRELRDFFLEKSLERFSDRFLSKGA